MAEKKKVAKAARKMSPNLKNVAKKAVERREKAIAGGGGMHQMGPARKTKKPSLKERAVKFLSKPTTASKAANKVAGRIARKSLGIKLKKEKK
jgi:hypothetical protein